MSFRSRRSLARSLARSFARLAQQKRSRCQSSTRFRGVAVADAIIPRVSGACLSRSRDFSPPADVRREHPVGRYQNGRALRKLSPGALVPRLSRTRRSGPLPGGPRSRKDS